LQWFNNGLSKDELVILGKASAFALDQAQRQKMKIASNWFNNKTMLFIPPVLREELIAEVSYFLPLINSESLLSFRGILSGFYEQRMSHSFWIIHKHFSKGSSKGSSRQ
jgi:hypothetical protein